MLCNSPSSRGGCKLGFVEIEYNMVEKQYNSKFNIKELKETRRELRLNGTSAEAVMWTHIKGRKINGRRWRRQFSVGPFIIDFYCPELKLGIELDGAPHFAPGGYEADESRTDYLRRYGIRIIRFENKDIWTSLESVIETLRRETECHVLKFVYTILWYSIFFSLSGMPDKLKSFLLYCYRLSLG